MRAVSAFGLACLMAPAAFADLAPYGDRIQVTQDPTAKVYNVATAVQADGSFLVAWNQDRTFANGYRDYGEVLVQVFDGEGAPVGPPREIAHWAGVGGALALPDGHYILVFSMRAQVLDATGAPLGSPVAMLDQAELGDQVLLLRLSLTAGGFAAAWTRRIVGSDPSFPYARELRLQQFSRTGIPQGLEVVVVPRVASGISDYSAGDVAELPGGGFCYAWVDENPYGSSATVRARHLDANGTPLAPAVVVGNTSGQYEFVRTIAQADGSCALLWSSYGQLGVRHFEADGSLTPLVIPAGVRIGDFDAATDRRGDILLVGSSNLWMLDASGDALSGPTPGVTTPEFGVRLAANREGSVVLAWLGNHTGSDLEPKAVFVRRFRWTCVPDGRRLCLGANGRFALEADWRTPDGNQGPATPAPLADDTGGFWFFSPSNVELLVKVLDGRAVNGDFWVLWGGMTNLELSLRVTDAVAGAARTYTNPAGAFPSEADTNAFPDPGQRFAWIAPPESLTATEATTAASACATTATALCLHGRFLLTLRWDDGAGHVGNGQSLPATVDSGYLWFFAPGNIEMAVKVLDGTAVNGHFWLFAAGLTNVQYTMTVFDTLTGAVRVYENPAGVMRSFADTEAF